MSTAPSPSDSAQAALPDSGSRPALAPQGGPVLIEDDRTTTTPEGIRRAFLDQLHYAIGKADQHATAYDRFQALALLVRDRLMARWIKTQEAYRVQDVKRIYYLSAEFLLGRALGNNLHNL